MKIINPQGSTPLTIDDLKDLKVSAQTQKDLNELEEQNIVQGRLWAAKSRIIKKDLLTASALKRLHQEMFGLVWKWAGNFRTTNLNIGVDAHQIQEELGKLLGDVQFWKENKTFLPDEIAIRFHHQLVKIHPFKNGNGRFSRLAADLLIEQLNGKKFKWGSGSLNEDSPNRDAYIAALKKSDLNHDDVLDLIQFART